MNLRKITRPRVLLAGLLASATLAVPVAATAPAHADSLPPVVVQGASFKSAGPGGWGLYRNGAPYYYDNSGVTVNRFTDGQKLEVFSVWGNQHTANTLRYFYSACSASGTNPTHDYTCKVTYKPGYLDVYFYKNGNPVNPLTIPAGYAFSIYAVLGR